MNKKDTIPKIKFLGLEISKLILGSNPFSGFSHTSKEMDEEMMDFYTSEEIKKAFDTAKDNGINALCARGDRHILRLIREYYNEGKMENFLWFAQTAPEFLNFEASLSIITTNKPKPTCIYHHGGQLDYLLMEGKKQIVKDHLKMIRDTGCITGMASHQPEFIALAEEENWDVDLYFTCFYNLTGRGKKTLTAINGSKGEIFNPEDPQKMCQVIKQVKKPCIAYKIFGAGRLCHDKSQIYNAFKFAVMNIKIDDFIMVGVFQKYKNQIKENVEIFSTVLSEKDF